MPVPRKTSIAPPEQARSGTLTARRLPARAALVVLVQDESGSVKSSQESRAKFIPLVFAHAVETGGPKAADLIFLLVVVVSGGVVASEFAPLSEAKEPEYLPYGQTPLGTALATVAEKLTAFLETVVFPQESSVKAIEILVASDCKATGESAEETESGVQKFLAMVAKYRAAVTVIAPDEASTDLEFASRLSGNIRYLGSDPRGVLQVTFESIDRATHKLGKSNPAIRNR